MKNDSHIGFQSSRGIIIGIAGLMVVMVGYLLLPPLHGERLSREFSSLMANPDPLPDYLTALAPYPGTTYPDDLYSYVYWTSFPFEDPVICGRFDPIPISEMVLIINGERVPDQVENSLGRIEPMPSGFEELTVKEFAIPAGTNADAYYAQQNPFNVCWWRIDLPPDRYVVEIKILTSSLASTYRWAFEITE